MKYSMISFFVALLLFPQLAVAEYSPVSTDTQMPEKNIVDRSVLEGQYGPKGIEAQKKKDRDAQTLRKIEKSLNAVRSLKADFVQRAPDGSVAEGILYLERPGKLRFDFGDDAPFLVVSNGSLLTFVDYDVKQVSRWPIKKTPLGILVDEEIKFDGSIEVPDIIRFAGLIKVPVIDPKRQEYGYIILIFEESTMELRAWEVVDAQGYTTRVALLNPEYNVEIDGKNFKFKDPRPKRHGPRGR